jgi:molybdate transport system substrate-binding protein
MKRQRLAIYGFCILMFGCSSQEQSLQLFAASSAREALTEFELAFEQQHPEVDLQVQSGASSRLRFQIDQGARADVFLSANADEVDHLSQRPVIRTPWLRNQMVLGLAKGNPAEIRSMQDLIKPDLRFVRAQDAVPAGAYALEWIGQLDPRLGAAIHSNMRSLESNVRQVRAKLNLGEVDAAFLYKTDLGQLPMLHDGPTVHTQMELALMVDNPMANALYTALQESTIWADYGFEVSP